VVSTETNRPRRDRHSGEQPSGFTAPAVKLVRGGNREAGRRRDGEETPGEAKPKGAAIRLLGPPCNRDTDFRGERNPGAEPGRARKRPTVTSQRHVGKIGSRGSIPTRKGNASKGGTPSVRGVKQSRGVRRRSKASRGRENPEDATYRVRQARDEVGSNERKRFRGENPMGGAVAERRSAAGTGKTLKGRQGQESSKPASLISHRRQRAIGKPRTTRKSQGRGGSA
jgi:hypothetical protein